jgi:hypothetical protein
MIKEMRQRLGATAVLVTLAAVGLATAGYGPWPNEVVQTTPKQAPASASRAPGPPLYIPQATTLLNGVLAPLNSLRVMQRAIALAPGADVDTVPTLALLAAPLKTTGLGPLHIGMDIDHLEAVGLTPLPIAEASNGVCQYYRIKNHSEPLGIMAVNGKLLRVDIWPGSLTTTRSGIRIGSTERDLVQVYGQQLEATSNPETLGKTVIFTPQDPGEAVNRLVFETDDQGYVTRFRAGQFPAVTWAEGCF